MAQAAMAAEAPGRDEGFFLGGSPRAGAFSLRGTAGTITEIEGMVEETHRSLYDVTGSYWKQDNRSSYNASDFGMEDGYLSVGLSLEKVWRFFTFQFDVSLIDAQAESVAHEDYWFAVGKDIEYNGNSYKNMTIPMGTPFSMDLTGGSVEFLGSITPFTLQPVSALALTPCLDLGIFGFIGSYKVDAGEASGVAVFQNPPEEFVIGGVGEGIVGLGVPEAGVGAELRVGYPEKTHLLLQGHYLVCSYSGSSEFLTSSAEREKNVDADFSNIRARAMIEFPTSEGRCFSLGAQYQGVEAEGNITAVADTPEEILAMQERFDKNFAFRMTSVMGVIGFTF
jgi:hypothetical protein